MECKLQFLLVVALHEIWLKLQFAPGTILRDRGELLENGVGSTLENRHLVQKLFPFLFTFFLLKPVLFCRPQGLK